MSDKKDAAILDVLAVFNGGGVDCRIFSIGPFGRRINFFSQQLRAFGLVDALLNKHGETFRRGRVLVIGAGLAGLSTASALLRHNITFDIVEKEYNTFGRQERSHHRLLHPSMNFWPEKQQHDPTTCLPQLNWHVGTAQNVVSKIKASWEELEKTVQHMTTVEDIVQKASDGRDFVLVKFAPISPENKGSEYDFVICCSGFGEDESKTEFSKDGYWELSREFETRVQTCLGNGERVGVSGIGDGGLIESLDRFYKTNHASSNIAKLFSMIKGHGYICKLVEKAERAIQLTKINEAIDLYNRAIDDLPENAINFLESSLLPTSDQNNVVLFGRPKNPILGQGAPIHKLLVAHAMRNGMEYRSHRRKINLKTINRFKRDFNLSVLIPRHRSVVPLGALLKNESRFDYEFFRKKQAAFEDYAFVNMGFPEEVDIQIQIQKFLIDQFELSSDSFRVQDDRILVKEQTLRRHNSSRPAYLGCNPRDLESYHVYGKPVVPAKVITMEVEDWDAG